jgi:circadian clock protein KaiA
LHSQLSICIFITEENLTQSLDAYLAGDRYLVNSFQSVEGFLKYVLAHKQQLDCLILQSDSALKFLSEKLHAEGILLPATILHLQEESIPLDPSPDSGETPTPTPVAGGARNGSKVYPSLFYHTAEVHLWVENLDELPRSIERAIAEFLNLSPSVSLGDRPVANSQTPTNPATQNFLLNQQRRLAEKLRERLGYLGVYYKRNPQRFVRNLSPRERDNFLKQLKADYREIVLNYFADDGTLNQRIDEYVNMAFLSDISVTQIVEIHMELMDDFSKQLKLEGRSEEILLDYRLTLIDIIAHLCEMYRRSIPRDS